MVTRALAVGLALVVGHAKGFHKRVLITIDAKGIEALVLMDVDESPKALALRAQADADHDGTLSEAEVAKLKATLAALARPLGVWVSGFPLELKELAPAKVDLRREKKVSEVGLSIGLALGAKFPGAVIRGMELKVESESPDGSGVPVEVHPPTGEVTSGEVSLARGGT